MDLRIEETQELLTGLNTKCQARAEKASGTCPPAGSSNNNNSENFQDGYARRTPASSGQLSSGAGRFSSNSVSASNESAFSSGGSSEGEESESGGEEQNSTSDASSASGRSSADQSVSANDLNALQLNTTCNRSPTTRAARDSVELVRKRFVEGLKIATIDSETDKYEEADLAELRRPLTDLELDRQEEALAFRLISRFLNFNELNRMSDGTQKAVAFDHAIDEATAKLCDLLSFRHHYQLSCVLVDHFCKEMYQMHGIFPFGYDKNQLPVLYLRARVHRRWSHELDESFRRYVAWQVNEMTKSHHGANLRKSVGKNGIEKDGSFGICFDCLNVSYACVDMDFLSFLVKILVNYYPTYCRYALCVDLPWLFRSVWKLVRSWLPDEAKKTVHLITSKELLDFIDEDQIPNSITVNELKANEKSDNNKHKLPENFDKVRGFQEFAKDLKLSTSEIKQFNAHLEKVFKEYKQLGAM